MDVEYKAHIKKGGNKSISDDYKVLRSLYKSVHSYVMQIRNVWQILQGEEMSEIRRQCRSGELPSHQILSLKKAL